MKRFYCTYFDKNYLVKALALFESLAKHHSAPYQIFAVCFDEISRSILTHLALSNVEPVAIHRIEQGDQALLKAKENRNRVEYYWTTTPTIILRLLEKHPEIDFLTYLDADLYFYSSPEPIFKEFGNQSVLIHEHRFPEDLKYLERNGRFNVGLLTFRRNAIGMHVLNWWREKCIEWCYQVSEGGKMGDQAYLNDWPTRFAEVCVLQNIGAGVGPWNQIQYEFERHKEDRVAVDGTELIFYHFHSFGAILPDLILPIASSFYYVTLPILKFCFVPYAESIRRSFLLLDQKFPGFRFGLIDQSELRVDRLFLVYKSMIQGLKGLGPSHRTIELERDWVCFAPTSPDSKLVDGSNRFVKKHRDRRDDQISPAVSQNAASFPPSEPVENLENLHETTLLSLCERYARVGLSDRASELLMQAVTTKNKRVSLELVKALGNHMFCARNWGNALQLFLIASKSAPGDFEARFGAIFSLIESGDLKAADEHIKEASLRCPIQDGPNASSLRRAVMNTIYEQICVHFMTGSQQAGAIVSTLQKLGHHYVSPILAPVNRVDLTDSAIAGRLQAALDDFQRIEKQNGSLSGAVQATDGVQGKLVLLVMRKFFMRDRPDPRLHETSLYFERSALEAGMRVITCDAEPFISPKSVKPGEQYFHLNQLAETIIRERPAIVVFDNLCCGEPGLEHFDKEAYRSFFEKLKKSHSFKLVAFYQDSWTDECIEVIGFVRQFVDIVWCSDVNRHESMSGMCNGANALYSPLPFPDEMFQSVACSKSKDAVFAGGVFLYNYPRAVWLTLFRSRNIPCETLLSNHTRGGSPAGASMEEYAKFLSRIRILVNFSARSDNKKVMTCRVHEAVLSKALLLEEENEETKNFYVPFVHYVPFSNIEELDAYIRFFSRNEELRKAMAERAFQWFKQRYDKSIIWRRLLH